ATLYAVKGAEAFNKGQSKDPDSVGVKAVDDLTLRVTLERPTPYFLSTLTYQPTYPLSRSAVEKGGKKWTNAPETLISNGPFMLQKWQHDVEAVAVRNPNYWGAKPVLEKIIWRLYQDPTAQSLTAYEAGELDQAVVPETQYERVRQALSLAIDRDKLTKVILKGGRTPANTIAPFNIPGYNPQAALKGGAEEAKRLLADAGYPGGQGFPELTLSYQTGAINKLITEAVQGMWKETLGVNVKLDPLELSAFRAWRTARKNQPLNIYMVSWLSDYPDPYNWFNTLWDSKSDFYTTGWQNADFDKLARQGLEELDATKRKKIYEDAEVILVRDAAIVPLTTMDQWFVIKPYVKGIIHFPILGRTLLAKTQVLER
ncbi:MAG: peptide ABC transporter substrate-binding protein, partial [Chloroflexi bacterium]|nr:peptide ABC transporter substrate-binding protein [Chloroflexota bacterium]